MGEYLEAFLLGNSAILGNVCLLPLYPGLFVLLANRGAGRSTRWLGVVVLAGVLSVMVALGALLHQLGQSFADVLPVVLPVSYVLVAVLGVLMLAGRNPFARLGGVETPVLRSPAATAFVYGMLLGPLTLPCTGPLVLSAFVLGSVDGGGALLDGIAYFVAFGLGFGWPLVVLPLVAAPVQRRLTRVLATRHRTIATASGVLLLAIAVFGLWVEVRPVLG